MRPENYPSRLIVEGIAVRQAVFELHRTQFVLPGECPRWRPGRGAPPGLQADIAKHRLRGASEQIECDHLGQTPAWRHSGDRLALTSDSRASVNLSLHTHARMTDTHISITTRHPSLRE